MDASTKSALKSIGLPGALLGALAIALGTRALSLNSTSADFLYYGVCVVAVLLAIRFRSSRVLLVIATIALAHRAVLFFSGAHLIASGPGRIACEAIALLVPINFLTAAFNRERGISWVAAAPLLALLFVESVFVAIICRPGAAQSPALLRIAFVDHHWFSWTKIPQVSLLAYGVAVVILACRALMIRKPVETGLLWSCVAAFGACQVHAVGIAATVYWAAAVAFLAAAIIENSYALAYRDELTDLPSRRSFNEEIAALEDCYSIAAVDIDHFKQFNDTYGHDTGDEVLRMVASRLAQVSGGGKAFRVGGEEFSIIFNAKQIKEVLPHLESLRARIEETEFRIRKDMERRQVPRGPDRRSTTRATVANSPTRNRSDEVRVTISIGVADCNARLKSPEQVITAADKALYRAKRAGRNRVESSASRSRSARLKRITA